MANRFIDKLQTFSDLTDREIAALARATAQPEPVAPRTDLVREGDAPGPVFAMLTGWACSYTILSNGSRQITGFLLPGDVCDLRNVPAAVVDHSIRTVTHAQVATIPRTVMDNLTARHVGIARAMQVARFVAEGTLRAWLVSLGRRSSTERVAHLLMELFVRADRIPGLADNTMELPVSQIVLADALGMTPVHINRVLQDLRRSNAIDLGGGMLRILDPAMLTRLSGFDDRYVHPRLPDAFCHTF